MALVETISTKHLLGMCKMIQSVMKLEYFIIGLVLIAIGLLVSGRHPRKWRTQSNLLYIVGMVLILYAIFVLHDPIEGIPAEIWQILEFVTIVGVFYGFLYKIEWDIRREFDEKTKTVKDEIGKQIQELKTDFKDRIGDLKTDIHRDIDRIERKLEKK